MPALWGVAGGGALYHHFQDKSDLFRAVYVQLPQEICAEMTGRIDAESNAVAGAPASAGGWLDMCRWPDARRIGLHDAPAAAPF